MCTWISTGSNRAVKMRQLTEKWLEENRTNPMATINFDAWIYSKIKKTRIIYTAEEKLRFTNEEHNRRHVGYPTLSSATEASPLFCEPHLPMQALKRKTILWLNTRLTFQIIYSIAGESQDIEIETNKLVTQLPLVVGRMWNGSVYAHTQTHSAMRAMKKWFACCK